MALWVAALVVPWLRRSRPVSSRSPSRARSPRPSRSARGGPRSRRGLEGPHGLGRVSADAVVFPPILGLRRAASRGEPAPADVARACARLEAGRYVRGRAPRRPIRSPASCPARRSRSTCGRASRAQLALAPRARHRRDRARPPRAHVHGARTSLVGRLLSAAALFASASPSARSRATSGAARPRALARDRGRDVLPAVLPRAVRGSRVHQVLSLCTSCSCSARRAGQGRAPLRAASSCACARPSTSPPRARSALARAHRSRARPAERGRAGARRRDVRGRPARSWRPR